MRVEFETGFVDAEIVSGRVIEMKVPLSGQRIRLHISRNGLAPVVVPPNSWIEVSECKALAERKSLA